MKINLLLFISFFCGLLALDNTGVLVQQEITRIKNYLKSLPASSISDTLYVLSTLEVLESDTGVIKKQQCSKLAGFYENVPECACSKLNLIALTLKCGDSRAQDFNYEQLTFDEIAYITRTLEAKELPQTLTSVIARSEEACNSSDQAADLLTKMQIFKLNGKEKEQLKCLKHYSEVELKIDESKHLGSLLEIHGAFTIANQNLIETKQIMKNYSELLFKSRKYITEKQYHKYPTYLVYLIIRSAYIMKSYERLIAPMEMKIERGLDTTFAVKIVNTLNEVYKTDFNVAIEITSEGTRFNQKYSTTFNEQTARYMVTIPGIDEVGDYDIKWSYKVPDQYLYSIKTKLIVMHKKLELWKMEYSDQNGVKQSTMNNFAAAAFDVGKEIPDENSKLSLYIYGLDSIVPRHIALNLDIPDQDISLTILGKVDEVEGVAHFRFPKDFEKSEALPKTPDNFVTYEMSLVIGDRKIYNCPLNQKIGTLRMADRELPVPMIPSKYRNLQILEYKFEANTANTPPPEACMAMVGVLVLLFLFYLFKVSRIGLNCTKWSKAYNKVMQLGFLLSVIVVVIVLGAYWTGYKLASTLYTLAILLIPTVFFTSKALGSLEIIDY